MTPSIALIGGRGYVGEAILKLLEEHPLVELAWLSSRTLSDRTVNSVYPEISLDAKFESVEPADIGGKKADVTILAMPNGLAAGYVDETKAGQKIIDVSADFRFDETWTYGLPEHNREKIKRSDRIANPGCYATAVQLALAPLLNDLDGTASAFGVSGYSGAGRTPTPRSDPARLSGNLVPYNLSGHLHELEISHHLGQDVRFMPHVAELFRGISVTIAATLTETVSEKLLYERFRDFYADDHLVSVTTIIPEIENIAGTPRTFIGGFTVDQRDKKRICLVACLDNLLKGAASQVIQNVNLTLGIDEYAGLHSTG